MSIVKTPLSPQEVEQLRHQVRCLGCGRQPEEFVSKRHRRRFVMTVHQPGCKVEAQS